VTALFPTCVVVEGVLPLVVVQRRGGRGGGHVTGSTAGIMCAVVLPCAAYLQLPSHQADKVLSTHDSLEWPELRVLSVMCSELRPPDAMRRLARGLLLAAVVVAVASTAEQLAAIQQEALVVKMAKALATLHMRHRVLDVQLSSVTQVSVKE
jgi:hypothetical protein